MTEHSQSMRAWLAELDRRGDLAEIAEPVDRGYEIAACLAESEGRPLRFAAVRGSAMPVVGNLLSSLARIATALGTEESGLQGLIAEAIGRPLPPRIVDAPPCQDVAILPALARPPPLARSPAASSRCWRWAAR
jgi:2,5-furandicarboxylate decarboxylase 1